MIDLRQRSKVLAQPLLLAGIALLSTTLGSCDALRRNGAGSGDPTQAAVSLRGASEEWEATLVHDAGVGVWCVKAFDVFPQYATPELVACDDSGRLWVMISYSGKWTPREEVHDGTWLGGLDHGDVDASVPGSEIYVGSQRGSLYQVRAYAEGTLDARRIAHFPGEELHTVIVLDSDSKNSNSDSGGHLLVFTGLGSVYLVAPNTPSGGFDSTLLLTLPGRVRDALLLPSDGSAGSTRVAMVSRDGRLAILTDRNGEAEIEVVLKESMGMGRLALAPQVSGQPVVLYATLDDGRILRVEEGSADWSAETIFHGQQGPRGIAAGHFRAQAGAETVAIFGYSGEVELLTRGADGWGSELIFKAQDKGHWVSAVELDGRNGTDELVISGYSGRIVQLTRPVGYGL